MAENHEEPQQSHHRHENAVPGRWNWYEGHDPENDREHENSDNNGDHMNDSDTTDQTQAEAPKPCDHIGGGTYGYTVYGGEHRETFVLYTKCPLCGEQLRPSSPGNPSVEPKKVPLGADEGQDSGTGPGGLEK